MTRPTSLARLLTRQWIGFGLLILVGASLLALLALFVLEDSFIDARLREVAAAHTDAPASPLPRGFVRLEQGQLNSEIAARTQGMQAGWIREFRLDDGRYLHVLGLPVAANSQAYLVFDAEATLRVNQALPRGLMLVLVLASALVVAAWLLAQRLVRRLDARIQALLAAAAGNDSSQALRLTAASEPILELRALGLALATAWQDRLDALAREHETLAFLAHELRTPLQSARGSLALLRQQPAHALALARLERAINRLSRGSHAVLMLASGEPVATAHNSAVRPNVLALVEEFAAMAESRSQQFELAIDVDAQWPLSEEVAETVLANLMLNAITHGGAGSIRIEYAKFELTISNPLASAPANPKGEALETTGYGLGLELSRRLLARFDWVLEQSQHADRMVTRLRARSR